uniref:Ovule protein n=1 Tax=Haemonchus contortus TaxID=6289 RepID=A0A7I5E7F7_HAECO
MENLADGQTYRQSYRQTDRHLCFIQRQLTIQNHAIPLPLCILTCMRICVCMYVWMYELYVCVCMRVCTYVCVCNKIRARNV